MSNSAKRKGDAAEREVEKLLQELLGVPARRKLGAGRRDDVGDIDGVPDTCIAVANYDDFGRAVREKLPKLKEQQARCNATFAAMFIRRPRQPKGSQYVVCLTPEMFATLWLKAEAAQWQKRAG